jgi:hypothetical protein
MEFLENLLLPALRGIYDQIVSIMPNILAALAILIIGWIIAKALSSLVSQVLKKLKFNDMAERAGITSFLKNSGFEREPRWIIGRLVFWLLMLTFILSAANTLELTMIALTIQKVVSFMPNIIAVVFIVVFGALFARFLAKITRGAATEAGVETADVLGKIIHTLVLVMVVMIAINQLEIATSVLEITFSAVLGAFALALAITLGLGTRNVAQNIISGLYARKTFATGDKIRIRDNEGEILEIGTVNTRLQNAKGEISIPNKMLIDEIAESHREEKLTN